MGAVGLAVLGVVYLIGSLGEPLLHPERSNPPVALYVLIRVVGVAVVLTLIVFAVTSAVRALRAGERGEEGERRRGPA